MGQPVYQEGGKPLVNTLLLVEFGIDTMPDTDSAFVRGRFPVDLVGMAWSAVGDWRQQVR